MSNGYQDMMNDRKLARDKLTEAIAKLVGDYTQSEGMGVDVKVVCQETDKMFNYFVEVKDHEEI